jgi:hypothetical protein
MLADLLYNFRYWTPRAALLLTGFVLLALPTRLGSFLRPSGAKSGRMRYLAPATGATALWMSEAWPSNWKRPAGGLLGIALLVAGLSGAVGGNTKSRWLPFIKRDSGRKEALLYAGLGAANIAAAWWPRPWRDYEWATGWSSGLTGTSEPPSRYSGERE